MVTTVQINVEYRGLSKGVDSNFKSNKGEFSNIGSMK